MKIVVIGGSGLIGSKVVKKLKHLGHEVVAASPSSGVDATTGKGLAEALKGAQVVVDVANSPTFEDKAAWDFFEKSGHNLMAAEKAAGVKHHVALSVVGTQRLAESGYFRAKDHQENLIKQGGIPYTIVQSTQFFEFLPAIVQDGTVGQAIRLSSALFQPIASEDVASILADIAIGAPRNATLEIAGPERKPLSDVVQQYLNASRDARKVTADPQARYFGIQLTDDMLVPAKNPRLGSTHFKTWFKNQNKT